MKYKIRSKVPLRAFQFLLGFTVFLASAGVFADGYDTQIRQQCEHIFGKRYVTGWKIEGLKESILSMTNTEEVERVKEVFRSFIQNACEANSNSNNESVVKLLLDILEELQSPDRLSDGLPTFDEAETVKRYLSLLDLGNVNETQAQEMKDVIPSLEDADKRLALRNAINCFIIRDALGEIEVGSEISKILLDKKLLSPKSIIFEADPNMLGLPIETWSQIFSYLRGGDLASTSRTCLGWHALSKFHTDVLIAKDVCMQKKKDQAKVLLQRKALSADSLRLLWDTFVSPINQAYPTWSGWLPAELNEFNALFYKQLMALICKKDNLEQYFEEILHFIREMCDISIQERLLLQICGRYDGERPEHVKLLLKATEELLSRHPMMRNRVIAAIARNDKLLENNLKVVCEASERMETNSNAGVIERLTAIARHYTGDPKRLLDYAEARMEIWNGFHAEAYAIFRGLLKNKEKRAECYPLIATKINGLMNRNDCYPIPKLLAALSKCCQANDCDLITKAVNKNLTKMRDWRVALVVVALKEKAKKFASDGHKDAQRKFEEFAEEIWVKFNTYSGFRFDPEKETYEDRIYRFAGDYCDLKKNSRNFRRLEHIEIAEHLDDLAAGLDRSSLSIEAIMNRIKVKGYDLEQVLKALQTKIRSIKERSYSYYWSRDDFSPVQILENICKQWPEGIRLYLQDKK